jgi:hypothetical protein
LTEDEEILRQRRLKFTNNAASLVTESTEVLEERKKKFAKNDESLINLDEEIEKSKLKSKKIRKNKDKKFGSRVKGDRKERRLGGKKERRISGDRFGKKSRTEIFGKKRFIKRVKNGKRIVA